MLTRADASKLGIIGIGLATGAAIVLGLTALPRGQVALTPFVPVLPRSGGMPAAAPAPEVALEAGQAPREQVAVARVKRDVRRALKEPRSTRFEKLYEGNGVSGRFSICGQVTSVKNVATPFLYLADTGEVVLFTTPANGRISPEAYSIFMADCTG